jgi:hypothetical protein
MASVITTKHTLLQVEQPVGFSLQPSRSQIALTLSANTPVDIAVADLEDIDGNLPTYLNFASTGVFFVLWNGSGAAVPAVNDLTGEAPELTPSLRKINGITSFSVVSATAVTVQIGLYIGT